MFNYFGGFSEKFFLGGLLRGLTDSVRLPRRVPQKNQENIYFHHSRAFDCRLNYLRQGRIKRCRIKTWFYRIFCRSEGSPKLGPSKPTNSKKFFFPEVINPKMFAVQKNEKTFRFIVPKLSRSVCWSLRYQQTRVC